MAETIVIKVSGHEIDDPAFLTGFASVIRDLAQPIIVVHGGGREITEMQQKMGIEARYVDGLRITDAASLALVEMVLCGAVNTRLVRMLVNAGVDALGMSGVDRGLVRAHKMPHPAQDMGYTGEIVSVRANVLSDLLAEGITLVVAPICLGVDSSYNVNADHVAGAVAAVVAAGRVVFLTNVPGVLVDGVVVETLSPEAAEKLINDGIIFGGMIPKVRTALAALTGGAASAVITNLDGLRMGGGTTFKR
ncbi:MAG: acetylglutamate kinase [Chloroflexota bacterium]|nr:acetylglutamate kinase [Chloroflexota bacterium]